MIAKKAAHTARSNKPAPGKKDIHFQRKDGDSGVSLNIIFLYLYIHKYIYDFNNKKYCCILEN